MEFTEKTRAVFYLSIDEETDWLLGITEEDDVWHCEYRFRYYHSDDPWDQEDVKNWYSMKVSKDRETLNKVISVTREMVTILEEQCSNKAYELIRGEGTFDEFMEEFTKLPFVHCKTEAVH
jgi:hypothetical protein